jgi:hypothetical protein
VGAILQSGEVTFSSRKEGPQRESELLFPAQDGGVLDEGCLFRRFLSAGTDAGLKKKITPRALRRSYQDLQRAARTPDVITRSISGHVTADMQRHYSTVSGAEQIAALEGVGKLLRLPPSGTKSGMKTPDGEIADPSASPETLAAQGDLRLLGWLRALLAGVDPRHLLQVREGDPVAALIAAAVAALLDGAQPAVDDRHEAAQPIDGLLPWLAGPEQAAHVDVRVGQELGELDVDLGALLEEALPEKLDLRGARWWGHVVRS